MVKQRHAHANHGSLEVAFPQSGSRRRASREHCHRPVRRPHDSPNASRRLHQNAHDEPRVLVLGLNAHRAVCVRHSLQARRSHQLPALARAGVRSGYASAAAARPMRSRVHRSSSSTTGKCRKRPPPAPNYCRAQPQLPAMDALPCPWLDAVQRPHLSSRACSRLSAVLKIGRRQPGVIVVFRVAGPVVDVCETRPVPLE